MGADDLNLVNDESAAQQAQRPVAQADGIDADDNSAGLVAYDHVGNPGCAEQGALQRPDFQSAVDAL